MRRKLAVLACVLAGMSGMLALPAAGARAADPTVALPITSFYQIVPDSGHDHLFLSDASANSILVTDFSGTAVATITGQDGVLGMALSPDGSTLYAALSSGNAVSAISTSTLQVTAVYPLGDSSYTPVSVAVQSGQVWVSYNTGTSGQAAIGAIDPSATDPTFVPQAATAAGRSWTDAPYIAADPDDSGVLVAVDPGQEPSPAASFDTATVPATVRAQAAILGGTSGFCDNPQDLAVAPGGAEFIAACGAPYEHVRYSTATLSELGAYPSSPYPNAVAIAAGTGTVAAGIGPLAGSPIYVYAPDTTTALNEFEPGANLTLAARGLALAADGSQLFAVVQDTATHAFSLAVYNDPTLTQSILTLTGPSSAIADDTLTLNGSLTLSGGGALPANTTATVTRTAPDNTQSTLSPVTPGPAGGFTVTDRPTEVGTYTYTVSYAGDINTAPATATFKVAAAMDKATLAINGPAVVTFGKSVEITGALSLSTGTPAAGTPVTVVRTESGSQATKTFALRTRAGGGFTLTDPAPAKGRYTYTASYGGNATTTTARSALAVTVARTTPALTLTTSAADYVYGTRTTVTATLGATFADRTISIYARPDGGAWLLLRTGRVNSQGILTASYPLARSTSFRAVFAGDVHNAPKSVIRDVGVWVKIAMANSGYFTSTSINGIKYRVYHHTGHLNAAVGVTPDKQGQCVDLLVQQYDSDAGVWFFNAQFGCFDLNNSSEVSTYLTLLQATGGQFRMRADYVRSTRDTTNLSTDGSWFYFEVVK